MAQTKNYTVVLLGLFLSANAFSAKEAPQVFFVEPKDGAIVSSPVHVVFGLKGMKVLPAGKDLTDKTSGHHHLIVDGSPVQEGQVVPADASHVHFGKGQTETDLKLTPGKHRLTLQFADGAHLSYGEALSASVEITVK